MDRTTSIKHLPGEKANTNILPQQNNIKLITREKNLNTQYNPNITPDTPMNNYGGNNITSKGNNQVNYNGNDNPPLQIIPQNVPNNDIQEILKQIEHASAKNLTTLPPRDIPMNTNRIVQDECVKPDYIPRVEKQDIKKYLKEMKEEEEIMEKNALKNEKEEKMDLLYNDIQEPLIIMILFFLFQLPASSELFKRFFPFLITRDGYPRISGYLVKTCIFGSSFFIINKTIRQIGNLNPFF